MIEVRQNGRVLEVGAGLSGGSAIIYVREATPDGYKVLAKSPGMSAKEARQLAGMLEVAASEIDGATKST